MSNVMKFLAVSGMVFWAAILACLLAIANQAIVECISRRHKERSDKRWERCTLCEGERWIRGIGSYEKKKIPCPICHGTGLTKVKRERKGKDRNG